jgi:hypothetical protein
MPVFRLLPRWFRVFEEMRRCGAVYVDKTGYFPLLRERGQVVFCARPGFFGKSLTVSALEAFFAGRKELFRGLAAERLWDSPGFGPRPVIRLDMGAASGNGSVERLAAGIGAQLLSVANRFHVKLKRTGTVRAFVSLIRTAAHGGKTVLLIDGYDAPVREIALLPSSAENELLLARTRGFLEEFYGRIGEMRQFIDFAFITGVARLEMSGVGSGIGGIADVSAEPEFGAFMGYTHEELLACFFPYIERAAAEFRVSPGRMAEMIRDHYDGFSFDVHVCKRS